MTDDSFPIASLKKLNARLSVGLAVRAARRSLLRQPPVVSLKRHQKMVDNIQQALAIAEELVTGARADMSYVRKVMRAVIRVGDIAADIRQGPNQLQINLLRGNPSDTVAAAIGAACQAAQAGFAISQGFNTDAQGCFEYMLTFVHSALVADPTSAVEVEAVSRTLPGQFTDLGPPVDVSVLSSLGPVT